MKPFKIMRTVVIAWVFVLSGCGTTYTQPGAMGLSQSELAFLTWDLGVFVDNIDGYSKTLGIGTIHGAATRAELLPGEHRISYDAGFKEVVLRGTAVIDMKPGHSYRLRVETCFWCSPRKGWFWIEDQTIGEVVYGRPSSSEERSFWQVL